MAPAPVPEPSGPPADAGPASPEPEETLADHVAAFGPGRKAEVAPAEGTGPAAQATTPPPSPPEAAPKGGRHRAKSQQAGPEDVPRIQALTKQLRTVEAERDALKAQQAPAQAAPEPAVPSAPAPSGPPRLEDFPSIEAWADARDSYNRGRWTAEQRLQAEDARISESWASRVAEAQKAYPDFDAVALEAETKIPAGSLMDAFILDSPFGADVLYTLQQDEDERQRLAALPPIQQVAALTLLGQRCVTSRAPAARTGSVATPPGSSVPSPPNPVRTGPMRASETPPDDEAASVADHQRFFGPTRLRRR